MYCNSMFYVVVEIRMKPHFVPFLSRFTKKNNDFTVVNRCFSVF